MLLNTLVPTIIEDYLPEPSVSSEPTGGTTDMVFVLKLAPREMQGAKQRTVCSVCGPDQSLWLSEQKGIVDDHGALWVPPKFLSTVIQLHKDQRGQVRLYSDLSGSFPIVNGVKQCCVLALTLFSIFFSMMLKQVIETLTMKLLYTSATVLTAVYLTSGNSMPTQKHLSSCSMTSSSLTTLLSLPTLKEPCST